MTKVRLLILVLLPLCAAGQEALIDRARELSDDGDPEGREICLRVLADRPSELRAWVELCRPTTLPRDRAVLERAAPLREAWARSTPNATGPLVAEALSLLLVRDDPQNVPKATLVIGLTGEASGELTKREAEGEAIVRRAERIDPSDPWVVYARFLVARAIACGDATPRKITAMAGPVLRAAARDPGNIVLLEAVANLPVSPEQREAQRLLLSAAEAHPRLKPGFELRAIECHGKTDVESLDRLLSETRREVPDSRYLDDLLFRLGDAYRHQRNDPASAQRCYEEIVGIGRGNFLGPACLALADVYLDVRDAPRRAVELLSAYHARTQGSETDPIYACCPGCVSFRIGEIQRNRLHSPEEASEWFQQGIRETRQGGTDVGSYIYYYLAAGDCLADAGRYREAMKLYQEYHALSGEGGTQLWSRWFRCYCLISPYFTLSLGLTLLLTSLSAALAMVVLVSRYPRARRYLGAAALLTLLVGGTQAVVEGLILRQPVTDLVATALLSGRTFLLVPAGMAMAAAAGIRTPRLRRCVRPVLLGLAGALAMGAITWVFLQVRRPEPSDLLQFLWGTLRDGELGELLEPRRHPVAAVLLVMTAGIVEELTCRLFFLALLVRLLRRVPLRWPIAIAIVALFWATAHAGMVQPEAWKLGQVFALGLLLGGLAKREGILACMVAHAAFNAAGLWV